MLKGSYDAMSVSLIIPTYNRASRLRKALESAATLELPDGVVEIVVVDNGSTDDTPDVVAQFKKRHPACLPLQYVQEERRGLHNARHAGARQSRGQLLIFTDDDATFSRRWLSTYVEAFNAHPEMVAAGGPVRPVWEEDPPKWLAALIAGTPQFGPLSLMEPFRDFRIGAECFFWGVNMAIRRDVLFEVGGFNPELFGPLSLGDGESGLNYKLVRRGMAIGYVPLAVVYHHIPKERMTMQYMRKRHASTGAEVIYSKYHGHLPYRLRLMLNASQLFCRNSVRWIAAAIVFNRDDLRSVRFQLDAVCTWRQFTYTLQLITDRSLRRLVGRDNWLSVDQLRNTNE